MYIEEKFIFVRLSSNTEPLLIDDQQEKNHVTLFADTREQKLNVERILNFRNIFF